MLSYAGYKALLNGQFNENADEEEPKQCDDKPVIIDDSTKTEDKVKNAIKTGNQDLIDDEIYKEKTLKKTQNNRRKRQRDFIRGDYEGDYDGFLDGVNKNMNKK